MLSVKELNKIYDNGGFFDVIKAVKRELEYGMVIHTYKSIYCIHTGGWSEDEQLLSNLTDMASLFRYNHFIGYVRGGAYYFDYNMNDNEYRYRIIPHLNAIDAIKENSIDILDILVTGKLICSDKTKEDLQLYVNKVSYIDKRRKDSERI